MLTNPRSNRSGVRAKVDARNAFMDVHPRADAAVSLRQAQRWIQAYKLGGFVSA